MNGLSMRPAVGMPSDVGIRQYNDFSLFLHEAQKGFQPMIPVLLSLGQVLVSVHVFVPLLRIRILSNGCGNGQG